ncbi:MAG TPA: hypothetical protein VMG12_20705 [Polyangiaceae bacterium]|nr:hypothetical protein [Polyangiaceae bacterium]
MAAPSFDDSDWPVYRIRLARFAMTEPEFFAYLKTVDDLFLRGDRFALAIDARDAPIHTPKERQEIAQHMRASHARYPYRLVAMGIVMSSPVQRGIFTAINWLAGPTYPTRPFRTMKEAEVWLREMLSVRKGSGQFPQAGREP